MTIDINVNVGDRGTLEAVMRAFGWKLEQQPGDDEPRPYCRRCAL